MQNEKLKKFTDFFVKYRRYFCAAVLFVILVVILVKCTGPQKDQKETQNGTQGVTQTTEYQEIGKLQKDADPELVTLMENYYAAYAGGDTDSLEMIAQPLSDNEKSYITTFSEYYEDYQNITCYSTKGATDDSYLVSVCYDLKFKGVDTPAPGMDFFYVERDGKGNLIINNIYSAYNFNFLDQDLDANLYSLILAYEKSDEVVALQKEVQTSYNEAVKSDEKLANMVGGTLRNAMAKWRETIVSNTETQTTESLSQLRKQIDECDDNIIQELAKRMRVAREIGTYKKEHGITVLQAGRYNEILEKRGAQGEQCGMSADFMKLIFEAIHEESVRQQIEIINK